MARGQVAVLQGVGDRLSSALRRRRLVPDALADRLGLDAAVIRDALERDRLRPDLGPRLAAALGVEPAWLLHGEEDFDAPSPHDDDEVPALSPPARAAHAGADGDAKDDADEDDAAVLTQADAVARVLRALPDGEHGRTLRLALLDALEASTREDNVALPLAVRGFRRRVQEGAL